MQTIQSAKRAGNLQCSPISKQIGLHLCQRPQVSKSSDWTDLTEQTRKLARSNSSRQLSQAAPADSQSAAAREDSQAAGIRRTSRVEVQARA